MPQKKFAARRKRKPKKIAKDVNSKEAEAKSFRREENLRKRNSMLQTINEALEKRKKEREVKRNAIRDENIKTYHTELRNRGATIQEQKMMQIRQDMKSILVGGLDKVNALKVMGDKVKLEGSTMKVGGLKYKLKNNVHMVGWGRETLMLGAAFERVIGKRLKKGFLVVPRGSIFGMWDTPSWFPILNTRVTFLEAGSGDFPDDTSVAATRRIADYCKKLRKRDILIVILSGGAEALLSCPRGAVTLQEYENVLWRLKSAGATAMEISIVGCKLSTVLGGELARLAFPAKVVTLAMSDIPGNPELQIAGGPTVNNPNRDAAFHVLKKYNIDDRLPPSVLDILNEEKRPFNDPLVNDEINFKFVDYHVIASSFDAVHGMTDVAFRLGLVPVVLNSSVIGPVREVSQAYAQITSLMILAAEGKINKIEMYDAMKFNRVLPLSESMVREIFPSKEKWGLGLCLLLGGAPTTTIEINTDKKGAAAENKTGANQELALYFSLDWYLKVKENPILKEYVVWFLGGNSSGKDGSSSAAGAYGYANLGPGIFQRHKELKTEEEKLDLKVRGMIRTNPGGEATLEALKQLNSLRDEIARTSLILPDRVLKEGNANFMFMNINDGDELLDLGYTFTSVCDLHVIRIVRYQCNCDGNCLGRGEDKGSLQSSICQDQKCVANKTLPHIAIDPSPKSRTCCGRFAGPKIKIQ